MLSFRLPVNIESVFRAISQDGSIPKRLRTKEQASCVVWRVTKDWIEAKLAIVEVEMADLKEVFLPYMQNQLGHTLYRTLESGGFQQITDGFQGA